MDSANPSVADAQFSVLSIRLPGSKTALAIAVLLLDPALNRLYMRFRDDLETLVDDEGSLEVLSLTKGDLQSRAADEGAVSLLDWMEDTLSGFLDITDRVSIARPTDWKSALDALFGEHVYRPMLQ